MDKCQQESYHKPKCIKIYLKINAWDYENCIGINQSIILINLRIFKYGESNYCFEM